MAGAGLVVVSVGENAGEAVVVINRITDSGQTFLRAFKKQPLPKMAEHASTEH
jgi:hypothetical protein